MMEQSLPRQHKRLIHFFSEDVPKLAMLFPFSFPLAHAALFLHFYLQTEKIGKKGTKPKMLACLLLEVSVQSNMKSNCFLGMHGKLIPLSKQNVVWTGVCWAGSANADMPGPLSLPRCSLLA